MHQCYKHDLVSLIIISEVSIKGGLHHLCTQSLEYEILLARTKN